MQTNHSIEAGPVDMTSTIALANCGEFAADIIQELAGQAVADTINNSPVSRAALAQMAIGRIVQNLTARSRDARANGLQ